MRGIIALASLVLIAGAVGSASADPYIFDLSGVNFSITEAQSIGGELEIVLMFAQGQPNPPFALPGVSTWSTEYTVHVDGLILADPPGNQVKNYTGGTIQIWSETPPDAPWTPSMSVGGIPPYNAGQVPARFIDGTLLLDGSFTSFATLLFGGNTGSISSSINWTGGSKLGDLQALGIQNNWHWNGWFNVTAPVPSGYQRLYGGKLEHEQPVGVEPTTWGRVKDLFKAD